MNNSNNNSHHQRALHRHQNQNISQSQSNANQNELIYGSAPIKLRSMNGYKRQSDGSVTLSVTLDKDQVECCVCLSSMTNKIYRCKGAGHHNNNHNDNDNEDNGRKKTVCHNICSDCQWQMRRMKSGNGHTKEMQCPICKVKGNFIRNRALERQLLELSQPCKHHKYGCPQRFFPWDDSRQMHEKHLCLHQPVDCPFCYQTIPGGRCNFVEHLTKSFKQSSSSKNEERNRDDPDDEAIEIDNDESMISNDPHQIIRHIDADSGSDVSDHAFAQNNNNNNNEDNDSNDDELEHIDADIEESDDENIGNDDDEDIIEEEEEKEAPPNGNETDDDLMINNNEKENNAQYVPPCLLSWHESKSHLDLTQNERNIVQRNRNEFVVNYALGIVLCFIAPTSDCECWKVYAISISPRHGNRGNSRCYIQYFDDDMMTAFVTKEQSMGLVTQCLLRPQTSTLVLNLNRLHPTSLRKMFDSYPEQNPFLKQVKNGNCQSEDDDEQPIICLKQKSILTPIKRNMAEMKDDYDCDDVDQDMTDMAMSNNHNNKNKNKNVEMTEEELEELDDLEEYRPTQYLGVSPCTTIEPGFIYGGNAKYAANSVINHLAVRLFALEESLKVGAVIDARDFTGKWYQAEVIAVQDEEGNEFTNLDCDNDDYLDVRRAKIHYLGYSQNYDEWLFVDTDSHRIAQRGTFTVGPDLRAIRRNTTNMHSSQNNQHNPASLVHQRSIHRANRSRRHAVRANNNNEHDNDLDIEQDN